MDETLIAVTLISSIFMLVGISLLDRNWFRRERFKTDQTFLKRENDLKFKKMARELGLQNTKVPPETPEKTRGAGLAAAVLPELLKNMDPDTLANIATNLIGSYGGAGVEEEATGGGGGMDFISDFIANNPEVVKSFLDGVKGGKNQNPPFNTQV